MKRTIQRSMTLVLSLLMLIAFLVAPNAKASSEVKYNSGAYAYTQSDINSDGVLQVTLIARGEKGITTRIEVELYVEKRVLGIFWTRVNIGTTNNIWTSSVNSWQYNNAFSTQLNTSGTYRVTSIFKMLDANGSTEEITKVNTATY